jgi:hypothetical protein
MTKSTLSHKEPRPIERVEHCDKQLRAFIAEVAVGITWRVRPLRGAR